MSSSSNKYEVLKEKLKEAPFRADILENPEKALRGIDITDQDFINVIKDLVQGYNEDKFENKEAVGAGPVEGRQGFRFYPI